MRRWRALHLIGFMAIPAVVLTAAIHLVEMNTIAIVIARRLPPRWDLATHLGHGWLDYHLLATGRIHRLLWDLWLQGYWPPALSIYQIPFYLLLDGRMAAGLVSGLVAFALAGLVGCAVLRHEWEHGALLAAAVFLALLISSPYLLAYASVTMTETLGSLAQLVVLLAYVHYQRARTQRAARLLAASLTILFFTKYNYFFLLAAPLVIHEWLERTAGSRAADRLHDLVRWTKRVLSSPAGLLAVAYLAALFVLARTGGFEFHLLGRRVSVHTIGNTGYVVLFLLLARLWYLHRRRRIDWASLAAADPRVRPLLLWFALPVTIWLASPYPNHIRDFSNLVLNRPLGEETVSAGVATYVDALRRIYFYSEWLLAAVVMVFAIAVVRYRRQPMLMRLLIVAVPLQFAVIALHQTRFPRFLVLTVVLLFLTASGEIGGWFARSRPLRLLGVLLAPVVFAAGLAATTRVVAQERFRAVAFENYTDNEELRAALDAVRAGLAPSDRLAIVGQSDELAPAMFRWELGPPSGAPCFPFEIGGAGGTDIGRATKVLLLAPLGTGAAPLDVTNASVVQRRAVQDRIDRGELALGRELRLASMNVAFRLYDRTSRPDRRAACE